MPSTMRLGWSIVIIGLLGLLLGGCSGGGDEPQVSGTYRGIFQDNLNAGTITVQLIQHGTILTGTWQTAASGGSLAGTVDDLGTIALTLSPSNPTLCPFSARASVRDGRITGTYAALNCTVAVAGTFTLDDVTR